LKTKKSKIRERTQVAPAGLRLFALLGDFALGHGLFYLLLSFSGFSYWERSLKLFTVFISEEMGAFLVLWYLVTMILRFFHTLATGLSPFQYWLGFRLESPWPRLLGGLRVGVEFLTLPLLLFSLPLLKGAPTIAEKYSQAYLLRPWRQSILKSCVRTGILVPLIFFLAVAAPLLKDLSLLDGLVVSVGNIKKEKLEKGGNFTNFKTFASEKYKFKSFSSLADGRFILLPDYEVIKVQGKRRISPYLMVLDTARKTTGEFKLSKRLSLLDILKVAKRGNPLFSANYPRINQAIKLRKRSFAARKLKGPARSLFDPLLKKEIEELIRAAFEVSLNNLVRYTLKSGPFLRGHVELRRTFIRLLRAGIKPEVDLMSVGNSTFLRFRQRLNEDIPLNKQIIETYIPIDTQNSMILELGWDKSLAAALSANAFRQSFLSAGEWFFDYKGFFTAPERESDMTALSAIDLLGSSKLSLKQRELLEEFLYRYYYEQIREALKLSTGERSEVLRQNIGRLSSVMDIKEEMDSESFSDLFINQWHELWSAFKARDKSYFNL
jgi:hypothetical protein